jgi:molybdenum-dependent DNA-binding transcriptional regulator ModE
MSGKERHCLELMGRIKRKEITLVKAADLMEIGYRQAKRIWKCFGLTGDKSLIHGLRGKHGGRSRPKAFKQKVLTPYRDPRKQETKTQGMRMKKGTFLTS